MGIKGALARAANTLLQPFGAEIAPINPCTMPRALQRLAARGIIPGTIIDIGASNGIWTRRVRPFFPSSRFLLIEALEERRAELDKLQKQDSACEILIAACGPNVGIAAFKISDDLDGSGLASPNAANTRTVPMTTLDTQVYERKLPPPFLVKLDTHGFEVPILRGAAEMLKHTYLVIIESYNFKLNDECLRFHEMCAFMESLGFRCMDLVDPMLRDKDGLLWQMDLFFARQDHPAFAKPGFK
jgi:FkbM family methyltransferase